jgi:COP9 signalosome complex subunit 1
VNAQKTFQRAREYCSSPEHTMENCLDLIRIFHDEDKPNQVITLINKARTVLTKNQAKAEIKLIASEALVLLLEGKYQATANIMTGLKFEALQEANYHHILSANDVALYGGLCALATFNRQDLKKKVLDNPDFKQFLELEPHIREMTMAFYRAQYARCLNLLDEWKVSY